MTSESVPSPFSRSLFGCHRFQKSPDVHEVSVRKSWFSTFSVGGTPAERKSAPEKENWFDTKSGDGTVRAVPAVPLRRGVFFCVSVQFSREDGSGSGFGSWKTVLAVPVPRSVPGKTVPMVLVSGSGSVPGQSCEIGFENAKKRSERRSETWPKHFSPSQAAHAALF